MKNQFLKLTLGLAVIALTFNSCSKKSTDDSNPNPTSTFLASTTPSNRIAVLEDFTGVRCQFCPDGHVKAKAIKDVKPDSFIVIATHGGSYATAQSGWPNYTTTFASSLIGQAQVSGYPAGTISRMAASALGQTAQISGGMAMSRSYWSAATNKVNAMPAPVNIGAKATFDAGSRTLTVKVNMYYTADEVTANNLNVALTQDGIVGKQIDATASPSTVPNYVQNNVLRHLITGQWGEVITDATKTGSKISKTYTYTVPTEYNPNTSAPADGGGAVVVSNLKVVAFLARGQKEILNAVEVKVQ